MVKNHPHIDQVGCLLQDHGQIHQMNQLVGIEFWTFIPLVLFFNTFNWYTMIPSAWETEGWFCDSKTDQDGLCMGNREFGSETLKQIKMASVQGTEGLIITDVGTAESNCFFQLL